MTKRTYANPGRVAALVVSSVALQLVCSHLALADDDLSQRLGRRPHPPASAKSSTPTPEPRDVIIPIDPQPNPPTPRVPQQVSPTAKVSQEAQGGMSSLGQLFARWLARVGM
jgi:hypothetical protein